MCQPSPAAPWSEKEAGRNLDDHHHAGDGNHDMGTAFAFCEVRSRNRANGGNGNARPVHLPEDSAIIATSAKKPHKWPTINLDEAEREISA